MTHWPQNNAANAKVLKRVTLIDTDTGSQCKLFAHLLFNIRLLNLCALEKKRPVNIPRKTIYRLSLYLRCLARLRENGIGTVSSEMLARAAGVKSTQLRKDLAYFGTFGTRGLGYDVAELSKKIADELGTSRLQPVILVGVGHLGLALLSYRGFEKEGFEIVAGVRRRPAPEARQENQAADFRHGRTAGIGPEAQHQNGHSHRARGRGPGSRQPTRFRPASWAF